MGQMWVSLLPWGVCDLNEHINNNLARQLPAVQGNVTAVLGTDAWAN